MDEEVVISSCNYCCAVVAESNDEAELELRESQHACAEKARGAAA